MGPMFRFAYYALAIDHQSASGSTMRSFGMGLPERMAGFVDIGFSPGRPYSMNGVTRPGPEIQRVNNAALVQADLVVAVIDGGIPSIGVPAEVDRAVNAGVTTIVFTDRRDSWFMASWADSDNCWIGLPDDYEDALAWAQDRGTDDTGGVDAAPDTLPVLRVADGATAVLPSRTYADDAGLDLHVSKDMTIMPGEFLDIPCGVAVELPEWSWGYVIGRSSTLRSKKLLVHPGVIDAGWRGELFAGVWNMNTHPVEVKQGERIAQIIVLPNLTKDLQPGWVDALAPHPRGKKGFGSTGV